MQKNANNVEKKVNTEQDNLPVEISQFKEKFPRLSKILPKFIQKSRFGKMLVNIKDKLSDDIEVADKNEKTEENKEESKKKAFREELKYDLDIFEVANKGIDGIDKEKRDIDQKRKDEKLKTLKENAQINDKKYDNSVNAKGMQAKKLEDTKNSVDIDAYIERLNKKSGDDGR